MPTASRRLTLALVLLLLGSLVMRAQGSAVAQSPVVAQGTAPASPTQPIPYSHKKHVALGLQCRGCHVNPDAGALMTFPPSATCMACHQSIATDRPAIQKLTTLAASDKPIPWVRVYQVPDYVYWSHASHLAAEVTCVECHGPVAERDVITRETNVTTMAGCLACHNKRQVYTGCEDCHEPRGF